MLKLLPVADERLEILQPFMPYLPTSSLCFHESNVVFTFETSPLPKVTVYVERDWPATVRIPFHQPYAELPPGVEASELPQRPGLHTAANQLHVGSGMALSVYVYGDERYGS